MWLDSFMRGFSVIGLALHQQAADELGGDHLSGAGEERLGEGLGGRDGYGSGLGNGAEIEF